MNCKALKRQIRRRSLSKLSLYVFILIVLSAVGVSFAKNAGNASTTSIPKPFFFTENKGQWDERVLFKCDAGSGMIWFLERDGFTLLTTAVDKTLPLASGGTQGGVRDPMDRDLPEMLRRHPPRYPLKGHALKFKFVKEDIPPLLPPNGVRGDNLSPSQAGGRGGVYLPSSAKYSEGKSNISQPFSNNVQDIPPLLPPNGIRGDNLSPSQAGGRGGVYLPASAKYFDGKSHISQPFPNNVQDVPPLLPPNGVRGDNLSPSQAGGRGGVYLPASAKYYEGLGELPWKNNYFLGNDSTKWAPNCRNFTSIYYKDVWEGIDIEWYESNGKLEFDFIVQPGANPEQIRIAVEGLDGALSLSPAGGGTQGGVDIAIGQKESHPPLVPPAQQGGKAKHDGGINNPSEPPQPKDVEGDKGTPPKSPKPVSRTADKLKGENNPPAVRGGFRGGQTVGDELILPTSLGELRTVLPKVYQIDGSGHIIDIPAKFQLIGNNDKRIHPPIAPPFTGGKANVPIAGENRTDSNTDKGFEIGIPETVNTFGVTLPEGYNPAHPLRIDPLIYSTFLGGGGNDHVLGICSDSSGGIFVTGVTTSNNFPTTPGAYNRSYSGTQDCFITHLNSNGSQLIYSTYLGGIQFDSGNAIVNDGSGGVIVTGSNGGWEGLNYDCFVAHLNSTGSQLIYYVFIGGSGQDYGYDLVSDGSGGVFVTGETGSFNFPTTVGAYDTTYNGGDCFVFHLNSAGQLFYSTYLGGSVREEGVGIIDDGSGGVFVTGVTGSPDFPTTEGAYDTSYNDGGGDCFISHLNSTGSQLIYSTFLGSIWFEIVSDIVNDGSGGVIVTGWTDSPVFPTTPGAFDTSYNGGAVGARGDCFVSRLNSTGSQLIYSTFLGGSGSETGHALVNDGSGGVFVTGGTDSPDFPTTVGAYDNSYNEGRDCYVTQLNGSGSQLIYSTFLGGSGGETGYSIISNSSGGVVVTGNTVSANFPTTLDAYDTSYNQNIDCFITHLSVEPDTNSIASELLSPPNSISLYPVYPNPFNSSTIVKYTLPARSFVQIKVFDITGREVSTLVSETRNAGIHHVILNGSQLSSGMYFLAMKAGNFMQTRKIVVMK